jgi:outer membrane protein assembly factor BamD
MRHVAVPRLLILLLLALALGLSGCNREEKLDTRTAEELYTSAKSKLDGGNYAAAVREYRALQTRFPFGRYAEQAQLEMAYAFYKAGQPEQALATADRFIRMYPTHPNIDYAFYIRGLTNYDERVGFLERLMPSRVRDRDQSLALEAFQDFDELCRRFPDSRYCPDARQRMVFLRNNLSYYEIDVASYYMRRGAYVAAANRARYLLQTYPGSPEDAAALALLHEAYSELDMPELAESSLEVLEYNYPGHPYLTGQTEKKGFFSKLWPFGDD